MTEKGLEGKVVDGKFELTDIPVVIGGLQKARFIKMRIPAKMRINDKGEKVTTVARGVWGIYVDSTGIYSSEDLNEIGLTRRKLPVNYMGAFNPNSSASVFENDEAIYVFQNIGESAFKYITEIKKQ